MEEPDAVTDAQQVTQTLSPQKRVKAAPSNLGQQHPPTGLPPVKSPSPSDSGGNFAETSRGCRAVRD